MTHDQNFKNLILDYPYQALEFFAAGEPIADLREARIVPIRQEQLKERLGNRFRELDVPLLVEWPDGRREAILFVIEEESRNSRFSVYRLAHYCLDLAELMATDRVVPVVIFLGEGRRQTELTLGGERRIYLEFRYLACELKQLSALQYLQSNNIVARLNLTNMRYPEAEKLSVYAAAQQGLVRLEENPERQLKYVDFIDYYADLTEQDLLEYRERFLSEEGEMMGLAQLLRQEGMKEGMKEGMMEGMQKGEAVMLLRLLEKRYGTVPEFLREKILTADSESLLRWSERVLICEAIDKVFH